MSPISQNILTFSPHPVPSLCPLFPSHLSPHSFSLGLNAKLIPNSTIYYPVPSSSLSLFPRFPFPTLLSPQRALTTQPLSLCPRLVSFSFTLCFSFTPFFLPFIRLFRLFSFFFSFPFLPQSPPMFLFLSTCFPSSCSSYSPLLMHTPPSLPPVSNALYSPLKPLPISQQPYSLSAQNAFSSSSSSLSPSLISLPVKHAAYFQSSVVSPERPSR